MRKRKYTIIAIFLIIGISMFSGVIYVNSNIPNNIKLFVNEEGNLWFDLPFKAKLSGDLHGVVEINNSPVPKNNITIDYGKKFSIISNKSGEINVDLKVLGLFTVKNVKIDVIDKQNIVPAGNTIGVTIKTDGILILGTTTIISESGKKCTPVQNKLFSGDYIKKVNGKKICDKKELIDIINNSDGGDIKIGVTRNGSYQEVDVKPVKVAENEYKIGLWVRDDTQGIGTLTYINLDKNTFGALGHGITDIDTNELLDVSEGRIVEALLTNVKKGQKGLPGEISGIVIDEKENVLGQIMKNTIHGIFGNLDMRNSLYTKNDVMPIGFKYDIHEGSAYIRSDISGSMEDYDIIIKKIYLSDEKNKGIIIQVTDEDLIKKSNGIVQGMSGSPIIQDGKLIGAVTHVFVQDSKKGYGTFIENMILEEKN
jgi:stage IV sporulation protein B